MSSLSSYERMIHGPLVTLRRRAKRLASLTGAFWLLWLLLTGAWVLAGLDYVVHLPAGVRAVLLAGGALAALWILWTRVVSPLVRPLPLDSIAARVDALHSWYCDHVRSALRFMASEPADDSSEPMRLEVVRQAARTLESAPLDDVLDQRPFWKSLKLVAVAVAVTGAAALWQPSLSRLAILRLVQPFAGHQWPRLVKIELLSPVPSRVPVGQRVDVVVRLSQGDRAGRRVLLNWRLGDQPVQRQVMQHDAQGRYVAGVDARPAGGAAAGTLQMWVEAGDDQLSLSPIEMVPRLAVVDAQVRITPPAYTGLMAEDLSLKSRQVTAWAGSSVRLSLAFNKAVSAESPVVLELAGGEKSAKMPTITWDKGDRRRVTALWQAESSFRFRVRARDESGFENAGTDEYYVEIRPDQPPMIQIENPRRSEDRTAGAIIRLSAVAEDDLAVATVGLRASLVQPASGGTTRPVATPQSLLLVGSKGEAVPDVAWAPVAGSGERHQYSLTYPWRLTQFPAAALKPGDVIEYYLEATDSYRLGVTMHAPAQSQRLRITIISERELLEQVSGDLRAVAAQINEVRKVQDRLVADTEQLAADTQGKPRFEPADQQVSERIADQQLRLSSQSAELARRLGEIAGRLDENAVQQPQMREAAKGAKQLLAEAAERPMVEAVRGLKDAGRNASPSRGEAMKTASEAQKHAGEALKQAADRLGDFGGLQQMLDRVRDLLDEQRRVSAEAADAGKKSFGKTPDQLTPEERKGLEDTGRRQEELSKRTNEAIEALKTMADRTQQTDAAGAQSMRQAASTGQSQSVSEHQKTAASAIRGNRQSQAQASQKSAELGLEMMLAGLRDAERRKLEELARKLAELKEQVQRLRQRQASHNLDNLMLREPAKTVAGAATRPVNELLEKSSRDVESLKTAPELQRLLASQQQTHLNTSDLSASAASVRGADGVASLLNKAAGRMERAMVLLRGQKLKEAYEPPQVEALASLDAALAKVEEMRRKTEEQSRRRQQEEVRKTLIAIQAEQVEVAAETKRLATVLSPESRRRADMLKLAQAAGQQGQLSQRMETARGELEKLGSIVFVSVARDAAGEMGDARKLMDQGSAGVDVQQRHVRILARLDAMIRALKEEEPKPERFAERSSGGGGGGGASAAKRLPPGAEMKLLRELQSLINAETKASDTAKAATAALDDLAARQQGVRTLLDDMLKKASGGKLSLGQEKADLRVAEENEEAADELDAELLTGKSGEDGDPQPALDALSQRLTRSRARLGDSHDPGKVTQRIQEKILKLLDDLVDKSQQQQQSSSGGAGEGQGSPKPGGGADAPGSGGKSGTGSEAANESKLSAGGTPPDATGGDIRQSAKEWGGLSARDRQAVIDSAGEDVVEKYRALVEDYYRSLSEKATSERR